MTKKRSVVIVKPHGGFFPDAEGFKQDTWREIFAHSAEFARFQAKQQQMYSGAVVGDRYTLIMAALQCSRDDPKVESIAKIFDRAVQTKIAMSPIPTKVLEALEELAQREISLVLLSSAPRVALEQTIAGWSGRNGYDLEKLFSMILGNPHSLASNLEAICARNGVYVNQMYLIGDRESDLHDAKREGVGFIGLHNVQKPTYWRQIDSSQYVVNSLAQLPALFDRLGL